MHTSTQVKVAHLTDDHETQRTAALRLNRDALYLLDLAAVAHANGAADVVTEYLDRAQTLLVRSNLRLSTVVTCTCPVCTDNLTRSEVSS